MTEKMELLPDLKSCPFCGGEGEIYHPNDEVSVITCKSCNAEGGYYGGLDSTSPEDARKFWNTREQPMPEPVQYSDGTPSREYEEQPSDDARQVALNDFSQQCRMGVMNTLMSSTRRVIISSLSRPAPAMREADVQNIQVWADMFGDLSHQQMRDTEGHELLRKFKAHVLFTALAETEGK